MSATGTAEAAGQDPPAADGFEEAAAAKLWALLPAVHRAADSADPDLPGPLRELLDRIACQVAVLRRGLDRLWENQSVETCDDWVLPYLADLLGTSLVASMDARGRRLDVANTIDYRRRKGTVGLLEQLAADVTGWECRVVEFFRFLGRTRHSLDPEIGRPADAADPPAARRLQEVSGLVGALTGTPQGGFADLRNVLGARQCGGPFDEFHHSADVRRGKGALGRYGIPEVGVFLWRGAVLAVDRATPVPVAGCPGHYCFDPTGRRIALWQAGDRPAAGFREEWTPLAAWQVPGPLTEEMYRAARGSSLPDAAGTGPAPLDAGTFWPGSLAVRRSAGGGLLPQGQVEVWPQVGRFAVGPEAGEVEAGYHYGLFSRIGAGPYDRRVLGVPPVADPLPVTEVAGGAAGALRAALADLDGTGTVVVTDGLTSTAVADVGSADTPLADVAVRAAGAVRAVVRLDGSGGPWVFHGSPPGTQPAARLRLEGLLLSGQDIVLRGGFADVALVCCTVDPGTGGELCEPPAVWQPSADGRDLRAGRIWVEGTVQRLTLDRCVTGPLRERGGGSVETLCAADSVIQAVPSDTGGALHPEAVFDPDGLLRLLRDRPDPLTAWLHGQLGTAAAVVDAHTDGAAVAAADLAAVVVALNHVLAAPIWDAARFAGRTVPASLAAAAGAGPSGAGLFRLNRALLAAAFPLELRDAALAFGDGVACVERCTVIGAGQLHRLEASESILDGPVRVADPQSGCVRFSAWSTGSTLPRRYESVEIAPGAPLFASRRFGEAGYAQLADNADALVVSADGAGRPAIRSGSREGSEMGAFCRDGSAVKERSLLIKYREYLPVGLTPVLVPMPAPDADGQTLRGRAWPPM
ncbi:hypothetical protein [Actinacidiphila bryophytorum]|uniref:hypothetical protein n=1 Tax=Actinacidiphila bryophytorum TaxID=1436133 RepID=UPI002176A0E0|nr:hypothetical protein [Actinacidiphila bryophytorum]UWE11802.1 hypothetical protein NYE86_25925 [Actinacidiphila bryophytorum]